MVRAVKKIIFIKVNDNNKDKELQIYVKVAKDSKG